MFDWLVQADEPAKWIAAVVAGIAGVGWLMRAAWRGYRRFAAFAEKVEALLDLADHELKPNSGSSMVDKVDRTANAVDALTEVVDGVVERLDQHLGVD